MENELENEQAERPQSDEITVPAEKISYADFKAAIGKYYDDLSKLIRIAKSKDDIIAKLSGEVQKYREGFAYQLVKPFCVSLISFREDCRKTLRNIENYAKDVDSVLRYSDYLLSDFEELMSNYGIEFKDGEFYIDGQKLFEKKCAKVCAEESVEEKAEEADPQPEAGCAEGEPKAENKTLDGLFEILTEGHDKIESLLKDNEAADKNLLSYVKKVSVLNDNYSDALMLPLFRELAILFRQVADNVEEVKNTITDENRIQSYSSSISMVIDGTYRLLIQAGVTVSSDISDEYDLKTSKILKIVPTDEQSKDRKVAYRHTDCYSYDARIIYPSKVEVYKYAPKN